MHTVYTHFGVLSTIAVIADVWSGPACEYSTYCVGSNLEQSLVTRCAQACPHVPVGLGISAGGSKKKPARLTQQPNFDCNPIPRLLFLLPPPSSLSSWTLQRPFPTFTTPLPPQIAIILVSGACPHLRRPIQLLAGLNAPWQHNTTSDC
jgi:hypothetical protein